MTLPVVFTANGPSGYNLTNSLRFRSSASAYLNRTPASAGNRRTWTWSGWVKRGILGTIQTVFSAGVGGTGDFGIRFNNDNLEIFQITSPYSAYNLFLISSAVYRDPSAWYHIVVQVDTTQATSSNRIKVYVNGVQITAFSTAEYPTQNYDTYVNSTSSHTHAVAVNQAFGARYFDGYLDEINFIDGQALTPSSFGSTNALTGVWQPAKYTGTYGTNGFYLPFTDNSALTTSSNVGLGKDFSGNGNYWTTNNISLTAGTTYDSMTDVPTLTNATTANYCVLNPLDDNTSITVSNGNLTATTPSGFALIRSTMFLPSGKYYWEVTCTTTGNGFVGISSASESLSSRGAETANSATISTANGNLRTSGSDSAYGSAISNGNVMMFALDMTSGKFWAGKSGTWFASGDPAAGTNAGKTGLTVAVSPSISLYDSENYSANFGQRPFSYTPPTGFSRLNTFNLPTSTIVKGNTVMDISLYTGNSSTQSITNNGGFQPDFLWIKARSAGGYDNVLQDVIRGSTNQLFSNTTGAEESDPDAVTSFNSSGFSLGGDVTVNNSGVTFVGWQWKAGGAAVTNTAGSITSQVSANTTSGFSIVTFTAPATNQSFTVGHGLGVAPSMVIKKRRDASLGGSWWTWHIGLGDNNTDYVALNTTDAEASISNMWGTVGRTSTLLGFNVTASCVANETTVAYCWSQIAGYSAFGSYTGNGSADGPFVYLGFRPRFLIIKASSTTSQWVLWDTARNTFNVTNSILYPNLSAAESVFAIDILSNGFKFREAGGAGNDSGVTYIYMAFAENPFKNALAR